MVNSMGKGTEVMIRVVLQGASNIYTFKLSDRDMGGHYITL